MGRIFTIMIFAVLLFASNLVASSNRTHFMAEILGEFVIPQVVSSATGTASLSLSEDETELEYHITIQGLTPTEAHFHNAGFDAEGSDVKALDFQRRAYDFRHLVENRRHRPSHRRTRE